jgi:hypothetical protein
MNIFTIGQSERMDAVLAGSRLSLANSNISDTESPVSVDGSIKIMDLNLDPCTASFTPEIKLANYGTSNLTSADISYNINGGTPVVINWIGSLAEGASEIINLPNMATPSGSNSFNISDFPNNPDQRPCNDTDSENFVGVNYASAVTINLTLNTDS